MTNPSDYRTGYYPKQQPSSRPRSFSIHATSTGTCHRPAHSPAPPRALLPLPYHYYYHITYGTRVPPPPSTAHLCACTHVRTTITALGGTRFHLCRYNGLNCPTFPLFSSSPLSEAMGSRRNRVFFSLLSFPPLLFREGFVTNSFLKAYE